MGVNIIMKNNRVLANKIYENIKNKIINLTLKPGEKINEVKFANKFKVSRTPIREAIFRLMQDGFLTKSELRGYYVRRINLKEIEDLYDVREVLEVVFLKHALRNIKPEHISKLLNILKQHKKELENKNFKNRTLHSANFHKTIALISGNYHLIEIINKMFDRFALIQFIFRETYKMNYEILWSDYKEHLEMIESIKDKNLDELERKMKRHILNSKKNMLEMISKNSEMLYF
jgi:DNA-binding GntR family transcriptional regulator